MGQVPFHKEPGIAPRQSLGDGDDTLLGTPVAGKSVVSRRSDQMLA